jgi:lipopolysaccharide export system protein LptC
MNIIYAAEKPSIAGILSDYLQRHVQVQEIEVRDNPDETGSFLIQWDLQRFVLSPDGQVESEFHPA